MTRSPCLMFGEAGSLLCLDVGTYWLAPEIWRSLSMAHSTQILFGSSGSLCCACCYFEMARFGDLMFTGDGSLSAHAVPCYGSLAVDNIRLGWLALTKSCSLG